MSFIGHSGDVKSEGVLPIIHKDEENPKAMQAHMPLTVSSAGSTESAHPQLITQPEGSTTTSDPPTTSAEDQPPSSPMMDLENDLPPGEIEFEVKINTSICQKNVMRFNK